MKTGLPLLTYLITKNRYSIGGLSLSGAVFITMTLFLSLKGCVRRKPGNLVIFPQPAEPQMLTVNTSAVMAGNLSGDSALNDTKKPERVARAVSIATRHSDSEQLRLLLPEPENVEREEGGFLGLLPVRGENTRLRAIDLPQIVGPPTVELGASVDS